eukprot:1623642-Rhodomonas_salina.2
MYGTKHYGTEICTRQCAVLRGGAVPDMTPALADEVKKMLQYAQVRTTPYAHRTTVLPSTHTRTTPYAHRTTVLPTPYCRVLPTHRTTPEVPCLSLRTTYHSRRTHTGREAVRVQARVTWRDGRVARWGSGAAV